MKSPAIYFTLSLLFFISLLSLFPTRSYSQGTFCGNEDNMPESPGNSSCGAISYLGTTGPFFIKIYVYVIRDGNGQIGPHGQSPEDVKAILQILEDDFKDLNIFFVWDCQTYYIDNQQYYDDADGDEAVLTNSSGIDDGISIFLFPDHPYPEIGKGMASGICGTRLYVSGNYFRTPHGPLCRSHIISHEMGHCLGLFHTFAAPNGPQLVNDPGCQNNEIYTINGDYVCDTPADNDATHNVEHPTCQYPPNGTGFTPDSKNIMAYTHPDCMKYFTSGQGQRMRDIISMNPDLQTCLVNFEFENLVINDTRVWTSSAFPNGIDIKGNLTIGNYGSLTIGPEVKVRFTETGRLIINRGGILHLNGGTLDAHCNSTWLGVEVRGDKTKPQGTMFNSFLPFEQGRFYATKNSVISNADIAILVGSANPTEFNSGGGGVVDFAGVKLYNNRIGVEMTPYTGIYNHPVQHPVPPDNLSKFTDCQFLTDDDFRFGNAEINGITMFRVKGINIKACEFTNSHSVLNPTAYSDYGYGISAYDARFHVSASISGDNVKKSKFTGWGYGIKSTKSSTGIPVPLGKPYSVRLTEFSKCYVGIFHREVDDAVITYNNFNLGDLPNPSLASPDNPNSVGIGQIGLVLESNVLAFSVQENTFTGSNTPTSFFQIGTYSNALTQSVELKIRKNSYLNLDRDNVAFSMNSNASTISPKGLLYECNENSGSRDADFRVLPSSRIRFLQGIPINDQDYRSTGNTFSSSAIWHFDNKGSNINYYYDPNVPEEVPDPSKITAEPAFKPLPGQENVCLEEVPYPPSGFESNLDLSIIRNTYFSNLQPYLTALNGISNNNPELSEINRKKANWHRWEMDQSIIKALHFLYADTSADQTDSIRTWLYRLDAYEADIEIAKNYLSAGEKTNAISVLNNCSLQYALSDESLEDLSEIEEIFQMADENGHSNQQKDRLLEIAGHPETGYAPYMARSILELYGENYAPYFPAVESRTDQFVKKTEGLTGITVRPNPSDENVYFTLPSARGSLDISNLQGNIIINVLFNEHFNWEVSNVPNGIYFYKLRLTDGKIISGKILVNHL